MTLRKLLKITHKKIYFSKLAKKREKAFYFERFILIPMQTRFCQRFLGKREQDSIFHVDSQLIGVKSSVAFHALILDEIFLFVAKDFASEGRIFADFFYRLRLLRKMKKRKKGLKITSCFVYLLSGS